MSRLEALRWARRAEQGRAGGSGPRVQERGPAVDDRTLLRVALDPEGQLSESTVLGVFPNRGVYEPLPVSRTEWQQVAESCYEKLYRSLIAMGASPPDAADALQDAFERALKLENEVARPDGWLFVTALRRWRTQQWRSRLFAPLSVLRNRETIPPPGEDALLLLAELKRLPPGERAAFVCRYVVGLSQREAADMLGVAVATVAAATTHATRKLRERLDANE